MEKYLLYVNKENKEIKISTYRRNLKNIKFSEEIYQFNCFYYTCLDKEKLKDFGNRFVDSWIKESVEDIKALLKIRL